MEEISVKGIILLTAPQGEYGRRVSLLTDSLGKVTAFAKGAAKQGSKLTGLLRPFTCAEFLLARGRGAYNIHGAKLMDSFAELSMDPNRFIYGSYVLEAAAWLSDEGMPAEDAKALLNLIFVTLKALEQKKDGPEFIKSIYELKLMVLDGVYMTVPPFAVEQPETCLGNKESTIREDNGLMSMAVSGEAAAASDHKDEWPNVHMVLDEADAAADEWESGQDRPSTSVKDKTTAAAVWNYVIKSSLSRLYDVRKYLNVTPEAERIFIKHAGKQFDEFAGHRFKTLQILQDMDN